MKPPSRTPPATSEGRSIYVPKTYWEERGKGYSVGIANVKQDVEHLAACISAVNPASILDVGSGWGRIYSVLQRHDLVDAGMYFMVDISDSMRHHCREKTGIMPDPWDGKFLPYADHSFDMVLSFQVMLHVPPTDVERFLAEHVRVSRRWIYIATAGIVRKPLARHCFSHDYVKLLAAHNVRLIDVHPCDGGKTMHWVLEKNR